MLTILLYVFIAVTAIQILYYLLGFSQFAFAKTKKYPLEQHPVSVLICAKNEAENLKNFLPKIIKQDYPNFEIVLINDASYDDTLDVMEAFQEQRN